MNLYIVRHGQTDWNIEGRIQGSTNIELNSTGINQAKKASELLKNTRLDSIYSSPLKRTLDTAKIINQYHNLNIIEDSRIIERNFGDFEGTKNVLTDISDYLDYAKNLSTNNVESIKNLFNRIEDFLLDIYNVYGHTNKNILIVTHAGASVAITAIIRNQKDDLTSLGMKNCECRIFENFKLNKKEN